MAFIPGEPPDTYQEIIPYYFFYQYLFDIADFWWQLADTISDVYLLGEWLSQPFITFASFIEFVANEFSTLIQWVNLYLGWLAYYLFETNLREFVEEFVTLAYEFFTYPVDYIINWLGETYSFIYDFFDDPILWVEDVVNGIIGTIGDIINDPLSWLQDRLIELFPGLTEFWLDPVLWLNDQLTFIWPEFVSFISNPVGYLFDLIGLEVPHWLDFVLDPLNWVLELLTDFNTELFEFFSSPADYVYDLVNDLLANIDIDPLEVGITLVNRLIDITRDYLYELIDKLTELLVEIIVENL